MSNGSNGNDKQNDNTVRVASDGYYQHPGGQVEYLRKESVVAKPANWDPAKPYTLKFLHNGTTGDGEIIRD